MRLLLLAICFSMVFQSYAIAQGFYDRQVRRNPVTGRMEVVETGQTYAPWAVPRRTGGDFYGTRFNPYTGTETQSRVQRNPMTGRLDVDNQYYNPWTGARVETTTRFNPFTNRYETRQIVTPPSNPVPTEGETAPTAEQENTRQRVKPRVIETTPPDSAPLPAPPTGNF
jgi:hypothetical protein